MRHHAKVSVLLTVFLAVAIYAAPKKEYFTEDELDLIRDAQELNMRVPTYLKLAERRLIFLGIMEKSQQTTLRIWKTSRLPNCCAATFRPSMKSCRISMTPTAASWTCAIQWKTLRNSHA